jgi:hypothetical protein
MTWQEMADTLVIGLCTASGSFEGCQLLGRYTPMHLRTIHDQGSYRDGTLHWRDRRWSRRGEHNFLFRIADGQTPKTTYPWIHIYHRNLLVQDMARTLGIRIPRAWADEDRARLRAMLGQLTPRERAMDPDEYRRALRWAARA